MRYTAVVNEGAGAVRALGVDRVRDLFHGVLGTQLAHLQLTPGPSVPQAMRAAAQSRPDAVLVLGGDGTGRTAAEALGEGGDTPIAFLPGGTMNILPKRVWGEVALEDVLQTLSDGRVAERRMDAGDANGRPFFVAAAFGAFPLLTEAREDLRAGETWLDAARSLLRIARAGRRLWRPAVRFESPGDTGRRAAALIATVGDADRLAPWREADDSMRAFERVAFLVRSWTDAMRVALAAAYDPGWRDSARVESVPVREVTVLGGRRVPLTLDGEPDVLVGPVRLTYRKAALRVLAPDAPP